MLGKETGEVFQQEKKLFLISWNATAAYEQAVNLDTRDPAVPLNFAVFLGGLGNAPAAAQQLRNFEQRVTKLRQTPNLDADPDVRTIPSSYLF